MKSARIYKQILILAVLLFASSDAFSGGNTAIVSVSATIMPRISNEVIRQADRLIIKPKDITQGYVDVKEGTVMRVKSNSKNGYFISFENIDGPFRKIWIIEGSRTVALSNRGGFVYQPYQGGPQEQIKNLGYRLFLLPDAKPGTYPWPIMINVALN